MNDLNIVYLKVISTHEVALGVRCNKDISSGEEDKFGPLLCSKTSSAVSSAVFDSKGCVDPLTLLSDGSRETDTLAGLGGTNKNKN